MFIPDRNGDDVPDGEPEILLDGWAWQDTHETLNTFIWGPGRLALRLPRRVHALARGQAGHAGPRPDAAQRGHLAVPSHAARVRGFCRRHEQSLGRRFRRPRPGFLHGVRDSAPVPHHSGRPLRAAGWLAFQPAYLRRHPHDRRPSALRGRHPARGQRQLERRRRRPCALPAR